MTVCLQLCRKVWGCLSLCSLFASLPLVPSISLSAPRHYPSPHSLYEYLTSPRASSIFHTLLFIPLFFLLSYIIPFVAAAHIVCLSLTHKLLYITLFSVCLYLPLSLSLFSHIICSSLEWGRKLLLHTLSLNAQSLFLI